MKQLIAKKPCSFGGLQFYIGSEIPADLVADPAIQERLGVLSIVDTNNKGVPDGQSGTLSGQMFTQEEVDNMIAVAVETATAEMQQVQDEIQQAMAELQETESGAYEGTVQIAVRGESSGENEQVTVIPAKPEEIQQIFSIMQMNATDGAEAIAGVKSENVLILLHAADTRKTIKDAAKKQADNIFSTSGSPNESTGGNETTGTNTKGADT